MTRRLVLVVSGILVAACAAPPPNTTGIAASSPSPVERTTLPSGASSASPGAATVLPIDPSVEPVALSALSPEAASVLQICQVLDNIGTDRVAGMGKIDHARDAVHYAWLTGLEPEIQTDAPAWVVAFKGEVPMPMSGEVWVDPTCIVVDGDGGFYATGPVRILASGVTVTPPPARVKPDRALPPLLP